MILLNEPTQSSRIPYDSIKRDIYSMYMFPNEFYIFDTLMKSIQRNSILTFPSIELLLILLSFV